MSKFIFGNKVGMTQVFDQHNKVVPLTVVKVEKNVVVYIKNKERDGYNAVQIGVGVKRNASKALKGHTKELGNFRFIREVKDMKFDGKELKRGDSIEISVFIPGDKVKVSSTSKGKGFAGGVKRHGFKGMPASHGHHSVMRHIGSIGQRFPQHTLKGKRMPGHMGAEAVTVRGLRVVIVDKEENLLGISGAIPGNRGELVRIEFQA